MAHMGLDQKAAVDCGYWPLYRYDPKLIQKGENPFQFDSKTINGKVFEFLRTQNRYAQLQRSLPEDAAKLEKELNMHLTKRHEAMKIKSEEKQISQGVADLVAGLRAPELYVLYGSETGTAEGVARKFTRAVKERGCIVKKLTELNDCGDLAKMEPATFVIFVSTCGDGDIPANALEFEKQIKACTEDSLRAHRFVLFALGDKGYPKFCEAGKVIQDGLTKVGATHLLDMGIGNQGDEDGWETGYSQWLPKAMDAIGAPELAARDGPPEPLFAIEEHADVTILPPQICPPGAVLASIEENRRLPPSDYERDIRHFVISNKDVDLPFHLGDAVGLFPQNRQEDVEEALAWFGYSPDTAITVQCMDDDVNPRLVELCRRRTTARQLLTEVVDIFGRPSRSFYAQIAEFASCDEKKELLSISTGDKFKAFLDESLNHFDILKKFPSVKLSLAHLLSLIPPIRYRLYSIANSADYTPGVIELTVVVNQWKTKQGTLKTGTSTKYIAELPVGSKIAATMTCGTFTFPQDDLTPMVMAGLGTGIAPIRSFVQDRMYKAKVLGKQVGPMVVFYGCRHEREEFFYKDEWELYQKEGVLTRIVPAFSHDKPHYPPKMVFVNQKMEENKELLSKYMGEGKGYFYMCGLAVAAPGIEHALKVSMAEANFIKKEDGDAWIEEMKNTGRYSMESY
jgi:sulfite reductase alpha subunit-like flavoprotein